MRKFWLNDAFVDKYARDLSVYEQVIYIALCRHCNKNNTTFVGCRLIATKLSIDKNTVSKMIRSLVKKGWVEKKEKRRNGSYLLKIYSVSPRYTRPSEEDIPKELGNKIKDKDNKNYFTDSDKNEQTQTRRSSACYGFGHISKIINKNPLSKENDSSAMSDHESMI